MRRLYIIFAVASVMLSQKMWADDFTVTIEVPEHGTLVIKAGDAVVTSGTKYADGTVFSAEFTPETGYRLRNWKAVDANTHTYTSTTSTYTLDGHDVTFKANFEVIPHYTVVWNDNESLTSVDYADGKALDFPKTPTAPTGYYFVGWTATKITENTTTAPALISEETAVTADAEYYAVYTNGEVTVHDYTFTSKSWEAGTSDAWTSGKEGYAYISNQGVQVTTACSGANATSNDSYTGISAITVRYCTNASSGAGTIKVKIGDEGEGNYPVNAPSSGGTTLKNAEFTYNSLQEGKVTLTVDCSTNSIYINSISIITQTAETVQYLLHPVKYSPESITLNHTAITRTVEDADFGLSASFTPANTTNKNITWTSSDSNIASVSADGVVTTKNKQQGEATITATTEDGGKTAACVVTVIQAPNIVLGDFGGLEIPAMKTDGTTLSISHKTTYNDKEVRTYAYEFDKEANHARWVALRFDNTTRAINVERGDDFTDDPDLDEQYHIGNNSFGKYTIGGVEYSIDRGHICASNDRVYSKDANDQTFYMSNMSPQIGYFNQGYWSNLESLVQSKARDVDYSDTMYVVKGGTIYGDNIYGTIQRTNSKGTVNVVVPKYYWMALLAVKKDAEKGLGYKAVGYLMEHQKYDQNSAFSHPEFMVNIDKIESMTGIDLFPGLPDDVENAVEEVTITNNILNDWGFNLSASADTYTWTYHNPTATITTTKLTDYAYATFFSDQPKTIPSGVTAYIATASDSNSVTMTALEGSVIPANCGVILRSTNNGNFDLTDATEKATDDVGENHLVGWTSDYSVTGTTDVGYYALNYDNNNQAGFFAPKGAGNPNGSFTAKAGKAYLKLTTNSSAKIYINWEDATGIEEMRDESRETRDEGIMYNLSGMRVNNGYKGIIISNGRKYLKQ